MYLIIISSFLTLISGKAIDILDGSSLEPISPNYCNDSVLMEEAGLVKATLGQFLGYECSAEFYHCRWQSDGFRTYRKLCKTGLVYDVLGTQNCNYDYNVRSCGIRGGAPASCNSTSFHCSLSEQCVPLSQRCDGHYECALEEDEQNCPLCAADEFACIVSEQCIDANRRCNGIVECSDGTDEMNCDVCGNGLFHCSKSGECILNEERCDGKRHCPHGEDEMLCKKSINDREYTCQSRREKIPMVQCSDGSDEFYCEIGGQSAPSAPESAISFSSNPIPTAPEESGDYSPDYRGESQTTEDEPSFPMLMMSLPSQPPPRETTTERLPHRVQVSSKKTPLASSIAINERPKTPFEAANRLTTQAFLELTTAAILPTAEQSLSTEAVVRVSSTRKPPTTSASVKMNRYPTKSASQMKERVLSVPETRVRPRNEMSKQLFAQPDDGSSSTESTLPAVIHEVRIPSESAASNADPRTKILKQLGSQLNGRMSPDLLSKIEKMLTDETTATSSRKSSSPGIITASSALISRSVPVTSTSMVRTFTSRVQNDEKL